MENEVELVSMEASTMILHVYFNVFLALFFY